MNYILREDENDRIDGRGSGMALPRIMYEMIEGVVGSEDISENPAVVAAYHGVGEFGGAYPPAAVVMPENTEEVAAVVKICNRFRVKFSCFVTMWSGCVEPDMLLFDLKKMNRIVEINDRDMYAVVEPGVTKAALAIECFKRGLQWNNPSVAGSAIAACLGGDGFKDYRFGDPTRSLLGFEWVTPSGDIVRIGSLGTGAGWFCPTGPGPSLEGLISKRGMGIITKAAIKLFPWEGPRVIDVEGTTPKYRIKLPSENFRLLHFQVPSTGKLDYTQALERLGDILYEIGRAEVGTCVFKTFNFPFVAEGCATMEEFWEKYESGFIQRETSCLITVWLQAFSREDLEYQENVVREIIAEKGGREAPKEVYESIFYELINGILLGMASCRAQRTSGFWNIFSGDSIDKTVEWGKLLPELDREFLEKGLIMEAYDSFRIMPIEYGHRAFSEHLIFGDLTSPQSRDARNAYIRKAMEKKLEEKILDAQGFNAEAKKRLGSLFSGFHVWEAKLKKALDPNLVANPKFYVGLNSEYASREPLLG